MKSSLVRYAALLVVPMLSLSACGGDEPEAKPKPEASSTTSPAVEPTTSASTPTPTPTVPPINQPTGDTAVWCAAYTNTADLSTGKPEDLVVKTHVYARKLNKTPVPSDLLSPALDGLKVYVGRLATITPDQIAGLQDSSSNAQYDKILNLTKDESAQIDALLAYTLGNCA